LPPQLSQDLDYRHFRVDADQDISADTVNFGIDGATFPATGTFVSSGSLPPRVAAVDAQFPPQAGLSGYWFRLLLGPGQAIQPFVGVNTFFAQVHAAPQIKVLAWQVNIPN